MKNHTPRDPGELRRQAEEQARALEPAALAAQTPEENQRVLHELRVHQIELEMQNEELRRAQVEIESVRARYFDLYDLAPVGYVTLSEQGLILEANLTAATLLGRVRNQLGKQPISRFILKEDQDTYYKHRKKLIETGEPQECELRLVKTDGSLFWAHLTTTAAQAEDGTLFHRAVLSDISERKRAEEALNASQAQLSTALEMAHLGHWEYDVATDLFTFNDHFYKIFRTTVEQVGGYTMHSAEYTRRFVPPDDTDMVRQETLKAIETTDPHFNRQIDARILYADGTPGYITVRFLIVKDSHGRTVKTYGVNQDITERKRAEVSLLESEALLSRSQELAHIGSWKLDLIRNHLTWSDETYRIFGCEPQAFAATYETFLNFIHPDDRVAVDEAYSRSLREEIDGYEIEHRVVRWKSGEVRFVHERCVHERDDAGAIIYSTGIVQDITDRKRVEAERENLQAQLRQAQKMESVGRLAGGVAHDFNNMLGIIIGYTDIILQQMGPNHPFLADLMEIRKAGMRSADLTRQLLAFARKQTVVPKIIDLNKSVDSMLKMLQRLLGEDINLDWRPGKKVWPVKMDPAQIDQILANLCVNARDAIAGGGIMTIETDNASFDEAYCRYHAGFVPGEFVMVAVSDNGCGMDSETMSHLFEPFYTTKEFGKGTGLGLATVYGVVKQNNGFINVESAPSRGTTFKIYLPRHWAMAVELPEMGSENPSVHGNETILVVEDEPAILRLITMMLERGGYTVLGAGTPSEAYRLANEHAGDIHLLMTDVVMPEMDGRNLSKNILPLNPHMKCLFMSGYTADVIACHGVLDEGVNFIPKPFSMGDLIVKVRAVLDQE